MAHIISYSHLTVASVPADVWDSAWFSLMSWKGYLQSFPNGNTIRISAYALENGDVRVYTFTVWDNIEALETWRGSEWSARSILEAIQPPAYDISEATLEDLS